MLKRGLKASVVFAIVCTVVLVVVLSGCGGAGKSTAKYKIGLVFDIGGRGDKSFNDSAYAGLVEIATNYKGYIKDSPDKISYGKDVEIKFLEPKAGGQDREQLLRVLAEDKYNLIYGIGFMFTDAITKVAKDFPNTHFVIIDGYIPDLTDTANITCISFKEEEGSFLVGAAAGLLNNKAKIGFVGGMDIPLIHKFQAGYMAGAIYINKELRKKGMILSQYIGKEPSAFNDAPSAYNIAGNMYKQGAAIVYHAAGASGAGLFQAAEEAKKLAIGVDSDQGLIYSSDTNTAMQARGKYILTSMIKRVDQGVFLSAKNYLDNGKFAGGYISYGLKENGVAIAVNDFNKDKLSGILDKINDLSQKIVNGEITVPDNDTKLPDFEKKLK